MNREDTKRLDIIERARPEILAENIPREIYMGDIRFLVRLIRQLEQEIKDLMEYKED